MSTAAWAQLLVLIVLLAISTPLLGRYMARVFGGGKAPGDRIFGPAERLIYRVCGVDPDSAADLMRRGEQDTWAALEHAGWVARGGSSAAATS